MGQETGQRRDTPERRDELGYALENSVNGGEDHVSTLLEYVHTVRRRWRTLLFFVIGIPVAVVLYSLTQTPLYSASATVVINRQDIASAILGTPTDPTQAQEPERIVADQAQFARGPAVAKRALFIEKSSGLSPVSLLSSSSVGVNPSADLLTFTVLSRSPTLAVGLSNAYANAYVKVRLEADQRPYLAALGTATKSTDKARFRVLAAVQNGNSQLVSPATSATKVRPAVVRNAMLALLAGLVLGLAAVFVREALDTRVRSEDEVIARLGAPLLARLATPSRYLRRQNHLVTVDHSDPRQLESFRTLRTNFDFANLGLRARSVLIVSARESEGKSTTAANLAVTLAYSGRSVALVDLDLRQPYLNRFFDLDPEPGLTDVAMGKCSLREALRHVQVDPAPSANGTPLAPGELAVLTAGPLPPDPAEFVSHEAVGEILSELQDQYDVVLVDSAPILPVSDAMILSSKVDGIIVVAHMAKLYRSTLEELARVLSMSMTPRMGVVLAAAETVGGYGYGQGYGYGYGGSGGPRRDADRASRS
jgi:capsular exopolysaccharide synthesis family protein